ncbi:hypothetical protein NDU88_001762 [Pleurodeles waltl]|uniref:Uncharacterized protein n=1 Tax=Pleurodeles waltl TaxID=8319 RepID=A0AAV7SBT1_PLEWA|nr:hypothetical protein NDU88_001762 [Pleurodeles waltl]
MPVNPPGPRSWRKIEAFGQAVQEKITAMAVDVNLLRTYLRAVAERSIDTEQRVTTMQTDLDTLKATVATLGVRSLRLEARVEDVEGRSCRCRNRTSSDAKVIVHPDGSLSLEQLQQEREEARLLVETATSAVSSCSGSLQGEDGPALEQDVVRM